MGVIRLYSLKLTYIAPETNMGLVQMRFSFFGRVFMGNLKPHDRIGNSLQRSPRFGGFFQRKFFDI